MKDKKISIDENSWYFQGDRVFWSMVVVTILRTEKYNLPMSEYSSSDWHEYEKMMLEKGTTLIEKAITKEISNLGAQAQRLILRKYKTATILKYKQALWEFTLTAISAIQLKNSSPEQYKKFWLDMHEWAHKHEYLKKITNSVIKDRKETNFELARLSKNDLVSVEAEQIVSQISYMFTNNHLLKIGQRIGTGAYEKSFGDFPVADISDKYVTGYSEIRPLPHEQEGQELAIPLTVLQSRMLAVRDELKKKGPHALFVFKALLSLWWEKTKGAGVDAGTAVIEIKEICKYMNKPRRSDRQELFTQKTINLVKEHIQILARITVNIRDMPMRNSKNKVQFAENLITISPYARQDDLWQTGAWDSDWVAIRLRIGQFCRFGIDDGKKFAPLPSVASIDPRFRVEQMLGWFLSVYLRINATKSSTFAFNIGMTLETLGLRSEVASIERLEKALYFLIELGDLIRSWEYEGETIDDRLNRRQSAATKAVRISSSDLDYWLNQRIIVEAVPELVSQYDKLADTHKDKKALPLAKLISTVPTNNLREEVRAVIGREFNGNQKRASEDMGIDASKLSRYLKGHNIRDNGLLKKWLDKMAIA